MLKILINSLYKVTLAVLLDLLVLLLIFYTWLFILSQDAWDEHYNKMYNRLVAQTGQTQDKLPFRIVNKNEINAYTDGKKVVIFRGMLEFCKNDSEVAMILGHELAHKMLKHTDYSDFTENKEELTVAEANADKMGAVYMLKAGYDICKGRELWKRLEHDKGNYQNGTHPNYAYRYSELNINCK